MNRIIIFVSFVLSMSLINLGFSTKRQADNLRDKDLQMEANNLDMKNKIKHKKSLARHNPVLLSVEYGWVMDQVMVLQNYSGTNMNAQLEGVKDTDDIFTHYVDTEYRGIKGLKIKIVVDKFSKQTDMGTVLDDIHLLEKNTDFIAMEISKDSNNLIVKGEVYGL